MNNEEPITALAVRDEPAQPEPIPPGPSYVQGFEGIAAERFGDAVDKALDQPVDERDVLIRPDDGMIYLPGNWYRTRLTKAFGRGGWALAPRSEAKTLGNLVVYHGALFAKGRYVTEAVGECAYQPNNRKMTYGDALEGARTNCLSRCCKLLEMAPELYDKAWSASWIKRWAYKGKNYKGDEIWIKRDVPFGADTIPSAVPAPPPPPAPKAAAEPVAWTTDDFLAKCAVALEWAGEAEFRKALDLFRVKNPGDVTEADRHRFIVYLRKLPKVKP